MSRLHSRLRELSHRLARTRANQSHQEVSSEVRAEGILW